MISIIRFLLIIILLFSLSIGYVDFANSLSYSELKNQNPNITEEQFNLMKWMLYYHINPDPDGFSTKLREYSEHGLFEEEKKQYPFIGFASTLFKSNPEKIANCISVSGNLPENHQKIILLSLWLSGTKEAKAILKTQKYKKIISGENYYQFNTKKDPPTFISMSRFRPGYLDMNWGSFCASGNHEPIIRILNFLEYADYIGSREKYGKPKNKKQNDEMYKEVLYDVALWSIKSNCKNIPGFKEILSEIYQEKKLNKKIHRRLGMLLTVVYPEK